ncbi:hypothetical protein H1R20_g8046, partial [Candolleomyces eurysporus]
MIQLLPSLVALTALALSPILQVAAHGYVQEVTVGSTKYTGYLPDDAYECPQPKRIMRKIPNNWLVEDIASIDIQCHGRSGGGSAPASLVGTIASGDTVSFNWTQWPNGHTGPVLTYMARVPDEEDVRDWAPEKEKVWFKIDHAGKYEDGTWASDSLALPKLKPWTVRIPPNLKAGQYLIRHEILALHVATKYPGVQAYPSCIQVKVTGNGTALPEDKDLVSFPGAYTAETPGIVYNLYIIGELPPYPIPGPEVYVAFSPIARAQ